MIFFNALLIIFGIIALWKGLSADDKIQTIKVYMISHKKYKNTGFITVGEMRKRYFKCHNGNILKYEEFDIIPLEYLTTKIPLEMYNDKEQMAKFCEDLEALLFDLGD